MSGTAKGRGRTAAEILSQAPESGPAKPLLPDGYREALRTLSWLARDIRNSVTIPPATLKAIGSYQRWRDREVAKIRVRNTVDLFAAHGMAKTLRPAKGKKSAFVEAGMREHRSPERVRAKYYEENPTRGQLPRSRKSR